jgi:hypothetical protein
LVPARAGIRLGVAWWLDMILSLVLVGGVGDYTDSTEITNDSLRALKDQDTTTISAGSD